MHEGLALFYDVLSKGSWGSVSQEFQGGSTAIEHAHLAGVLAAEAVVAAGAKTGAVDVDCPACCTALGWTVELAQLRGLGKRRVRKAYSVPMRLIAFACGP